MDMTKEVPVNHELTIEPDPILRRLFDYLEDQTVWVLTSNYSGQTIYFRTQTQALDFLRKHLQKMSRQPNCQFITCQDLITKKVTEADLEKYIEELKIGHTGLKYEINHNRVCFSVQFDQSEIMWRSYWLKEFPLSPNYQQLGLNPLGF